MAGGPGSAGRGSAGRALCPSAPCRPGHLLLGVVEEVGLRFLPVRLPVDRAFVAEAEAGRRPTERFRFAAPCRAGGCAKWSDGACSVGAQAVRLAGTVPAGEVPLCAIRDRCRWRAEHGERVCLTCRWVVTDRRGDGAPGGPDEEG